MGLVHSYKQYLNQCRCGYASVLFRDCFFNRLFLQMVNKAGYKHLAEGYLVPIARPAGVFVVMLILVIFIPVLQLPVGTASYTILFVKAMVPLFGTIVFYRLVNIISLYFEGRAYQ